MESLGRYCGRFWKKAFGAVCKNNAAYVWSENVKRECGKTENSMKEFGVYQGIGFESLFVFVGYGWTDEKCIR